MEELMVEAELERRIREEEILIVEVGSRSCEPCGAIRGKLERWLVERPEAAGIYVDIEKFPALTAQAGIFTVPAVLIYVCGHMTVRESGYFSLEQVLQKLDITCSLL